MFKSNYFPPKKMNSKQLFDNFESFLFRNNLIKITIKIIFQNHSKYCKFVAIYSKKSTNRSNNSSVLILQIIETFSLQNLPLIYRFGHDFVKQLFRIESFSGGKVLLLNMVKSRKNALYFGIILMYLDFTIFLINTFNL